MKWQTNIRRLQIDITSYCNAKCPGCARNINGNETVDFLKLNHFDVEIWNRLATDDLKDTRLETLTLNGNWGDCGMHPYLPDMLQTFIDNHPNTAIFLATNGGMHKTSWWEKLGNVLSKSASHIVAFAVDGLKDTNHLYRRNINFDKVVANIKSFVKGNGRAQIVFTVFDHNKHQINEIIALGKELGCAEVRIRKSFDEYMEVITDSETYAVTSNYDKDDILYIVNEVDEISKPVPYKYAEEQKTKCPWYNVGEIQIDPWGNVWPCCHISNIQFDNDKSTYKITNNKDKFNLRNNNLKTILGNEYFNVTLNNAVRCGTWQVCKDSCDV